MRIFLYGSQTFNLKKSISVIKFEPNSGSRSGQQPGNLEPNLQVILGHITKNFIAQKLCKNLLKFSQWIIDRYIDNCILKPNIQPVQ